jgi:putative ABC transport system permease protein
MRALDRWREVLEVLSRRKLRTALCGSSVAWGIFILVILLAAGEGLQTGIRVDFAPEVGNRITVSGDHAAIAHAGNHAGRAVRLDDTDLALTRLLFRDVLEASSGQYDLRSRALVQYADRDEMLPIRGCEPGQTQVDNITVLSGRFVNPADCWKCAR